jgi:ketosteroid isomerase-like protein
MTRATRWLSSFACMGRGKESGIEVEAPVAHLWTLRDGKGVRIRVLDRETALEAAGLRE